MKKVIFLLSVLSCLAVFWTTVSIQAAETLTIDGTGDSQALLRKMATRFEALHPGTEVMVPDSIGSGGGIKAVKARKTDLARTARGLKDKEKPGLTEIPYGKSPVVFAANSSVSMVNGLTSAQVLDIFAGKITNWSTIGGPDAKLYAVTRETGDSSRHVLEKTLDGFKDLTMKAKTFYTTPETAMAIRDHRDTIGYVPLSVAKEYGLHVLAIDGKNPTEGGEDYPYTTLFYLVKNEVPSALALTFIDFVKSDEGRRIMRENGVIPVQ